MLVPHPLASAARSRPGHVLLRTPEGDLSAEQLLQRVARLAGELAAGGAQAGQTIAFHASPSLDTALTLHAIGWLGAVAAPLDPRLPPGTLDDTLRRCGARWLLGASSAQVPTLSPQGAEPLPERDWPLDEPRLVLFSSGSSGQPQCSTLTTGQLLFSAFGSALRLGHDPEDRCLCCLPLHHIGGLSVLFRSMIYGITALLHPRFDPLRVAQALDSGEASLVSLVPTQLQRVLDERPARPFPPSLRVILLGGAPCEPTLLARCAALGVPVSLTWGMTETASQVATRWPGDTSPLPHVGPPLPFVRVQADPEGVLHVYGPSAQGHQRSQDLGHLDEEGRVVVEGRADRVIVSGGEKIDLSRLEQILCQHPAVAEAAVVGVPDPRWGQRPAAWIVLHPGASAPSAEDLRALVSRQRPAWWTPDRVTVLDALPRTALGKLYRGGLA